MKWTRITTPDGPAWEADDGTVVTRLRYVPEHYAEGTAVTIDDEEPSQARAPRAKRPRKRPA
jgi:hypothetical protein